MGPETETESAVERSELFTVPAWSARVAPTTPWIRPLVDDIDETLDDGTLDFTSCSGHQTLPNLQDRTEPHWLELFSFVTAVFESIAATAGEVRWPRHGLRAWGLRIDADSVAKDRAHGPTRTLLTHNHAPALLTSVFTCELPDAPAPPELSTVFYNPASHMVCPWQPRLALVPPDVGLLTVFPGWIEHAAPIVAPLAEGQRRIIVSIDYFPELEPA